MQLSFYIIVLFAVKGATPATTNRNARNSSGSEPDLSEIIRSDSSGDEGGNVPDRVPLSPKNNDPQSSRSLPAYYTFFNMYYPKRGKFEQIHHSPDIDYSRYPLIPYVDIHEFYEMRKFQRAYDLWHSIGDAETLKAEGHNDEQRQDAVHHLMRMEDRGGGAFFSTAQRGICLNQKKSVESAMADHLMGDLPVLRKSSRTKRLSFTFPGQEDHFDPGNAETGYGSAEPDYENGYDSNGAVMYDSDED